MIGGLFGPSYGMFGDQRAMSDDDIADMQIAQARYHMNAVPDYRLLQNYRPPVHVPQGWADWYEMADAQ